MEFIEQPMASPSLQRRPWLDRSVLAKAGLAEIDAAPPARLKA